MKKSEARLTAIVNGHRTYVPEKPCARGHSLRSVSGTCIECRKIREKIKYYADPEKTKARVAAKYHANAEKMRIRRKEWYAKNAVKEREIAKLRSREWRKNNPNKESVHLSKTKYKKSNKGMAKANANTAKRRTAKMYRTPKWLTPIDYERMENTYKLAALQTKITGERWHVDHIIPLQGKLVSGLHVPSNLEAVPAKYNIKKSNKHLLAL